MKELLKREFVYGKKPLDWAMLALGLVLQLAAIAYGYMVGTPDDAISIVCALAGVLTVILCAQGKISYYIFNFVQMITYVVGVVIPNHLYGEGIEYIFYFATTIWGIFVWIKGYKLTQESSSEFVAKKLSRVGNAVLTAILVAGTAVMTALLKRTDDPAPFLDSISTVPAFVAQVLMCAGYREQWICWLLIDVASVVMYVALGNWMMVAMFTFWCINAVYGWVKWTKSNQYNGWTELTA